MDASYSQVPGLDQLGAAHGQVLCGGAGSAADVLASYQQHVGWLAQALTASIEALSAQEGYNARAMDIADEGASSSAESVGFPSRPELAFQPFSFAFPVVGAVLSLSQLAQSFAGTRVSDLMRACQAWNLMSGEIGDAVAQLADIAEELVAENTGDVFAAAAKIIGQVVQAGQDFASNAATMAATLNRVHSVASWGEAQVAAAQAGIEAIPDPVAKKAAEQQFLATFMGGEFPAALQAGVPPIAGLMDSAQTTAAQWQSGGEGTGGAGGGGANAAAHGASGGQSGIQVGFGSAPDAAAPLRVADGLRIGTAGPAGGLGGAAAPVTVGSSLHAVGQVVDGITKLFGNLGTQQAGVGAEALPPHGLQAGPTPGLGSGIAPPGSVTASLDPAPMPIVGQQFTKSGMNGIDSPRTQGTYAAPSGGPVTGVTTPSGGAAGPMPVSGPMGAPLTGAWNKRAAAAPIGMQGQSPGAGSHGFGGQAVPVAAAAATGAGSRGGFMGGVPMGSAAGAGQGQQGNSKRTRNKLERNKNVFDLIGELKPVLDGPIGAWVREPG